MANRTNFLHFKTSAGFQAEIEKNSGLTGDAALTNTSNGCYYFICFIRETNQIYTHGNLYACATYDDTEVRDLIQSLTSVVETKADISALTDLSNEVEENEKVAAAALTDLKETKADLSAMPTNVSQLTNDSGYITASDIPETDLTGYATQTWVENKNYLTSIPDEYITETELNNKGYAVATNIPTNTSQLINDSNFVTESVLNSSLATKADSQVVYNLTTNLENTSINYLSSIVTAPFMCILKVTEGFDLNEFSVFMGDKDITDECTQNNIIVIPEISADIIINGIATEGSSGGETPEEPDTTYIGTVNEDNSITLNDDSLSGTYTLKYVDSNDNNIENFDLITTIDL